MSTVNPPSPPEEGPSALRAFLRRHPALREVVVDFWRSGRYAWHQPGASATSLLRLVQPARRLIQAPLEVAVDLPTLRDSLHLRSELEQRGLEVVEGGHTLYIPPQPGLTELADEFAWLFPPGTGLKILRDLRAPNRSHYLRPDVSSTVRRRLIGTPLHQIAAANFLFHSGIGPECRDVVELRAGRTTLTAFALEHVEGREATPSELAAFRIRLAALMDRSSLRLALRDWETHDDFSPPNANGNLLVRDGSMAYVDFQNFYLADTFAWTRDVLDRYADAFHFGDRRLFRSRLLYQSIPGLRKGAKRDTQRRWVRLRAALARAGVDPRNRMVLDVGCNSAMMLLEALANGAAWVVGWDAPEVAEGSRELLASLGATRYTIIGETMTPSTDLVASIPERLHDKLGGSVVFYLAVHQHLGVLESLREIDWEALVFEGHQDDAPEDVHRLVAPLLADGARVADDYPLADGKSSSRRVLVLVRRPR